MEKFIIGFSETTLLVCIAAIFIILFATILKVLNEVSFFQGNTALIVALSLAVSLLSITGLTQLIDGGDGLQEVNGNGGRTGGVLDLILLLYAALGITILLLLLLRCIDKIFRSEKVKKYFEETKHGETEQRYQLENTSEAHEKSNEDRFTK